MSEYIRASDGNGEPDRAYVVVDREVGDMLLNVDSVLNFPHKGIATSGTIDQGTGLIDPSTASVFYFTLSGSMVHIDRFAPGYIDTGNTEGETVLIKPTTSWADEVSEGVNEAIEAVGEMQQEIDTIPSKVASSLLPIHTDEANSRVGINKVPTQGALDVDGDIYASDVIVSNSMWCISSSSSANSGDFSSWTNKQTTPFITRSGSTFTVNKEGFYRIELYCNFTVSSAGTSANNEFIRSLIRFDTDYANEDFVAGFAPVLRTTLTFSTISIGLYLPENATFKAELLTSTGLSDPITIRAMNISATKV